MGIDIYILLNNLNLNIGKTNGYNNDILVSNTDLKIGLNRDINRNHKKLTPPNVSNTLEKLQSARNKWNKDRMKQLDFINKRLLEKIRPGHTSIMLIKQCLSTIEYLQKKKKKTFTTWTWIIWLLPCIRGPNNGELLFAAVDTGIATYAPYKYLK